MRPLIPGRVARGGWAPATVVVGTALDVVFVVVAEGGGTESKVNRCGFRGFGRAVAVAVAAVPFVFELLGPEPVAAPPNPTALVR